MKKKWFPGLLDLGKIERNPRPWMMRMGLEMLRGFFHFANLPGVRSVHPWMQETNTNMYWIPVNKSLERDKDVPLPYEVVERFIEESSVHVVMNFCGCRAAYECNRFPSEIGCLMMGEDARKIPPEFSHTVTKEEARKHLHKAMKAGLPPFIGKARIDNFIFGVPDNSKLLTVCFCCDCCCVTDLVKHVPSKERKEIIHPLEGLKVFVDENECVGCGKCAEHCFINIIALESEKAHIPQEDCLGCGRCVSVCRKNAIKISLDNPEFVEKAVAGIKAYVNMEKPE